MRAAALTLFGPPPHTTPPLPHPPMLKDPVGTQQPLFSLQHHAHISGGYFAEFPYLISTRTSKDTWELRPSAEVHPCCLRLASFQPSKAQL